MWSVIKLISKFLVVSFCSNLTWNTEPLFLHSHAAHAILLIKVFGVKPFSGIAIVGVLQVFNIFLMYRVLTWPEHTVSQNWQSNSLKVYVF